MDDTPHASSKAATYAHMSAYSISALTEPFMLHAFRPPIPADLPRCFLHCHSAPAAIAGGARLSPPKLLSLPEALKRSSLFQTHYPKATITHQYFKYIYGRDHGLIHPCPPKLAPILEGNVSKTTSCFNKSLQSPLVDRNTQHG